MKRSAILVAMSAALVGTALLVPTAASAAPVAPAGSASGAETSLVNRLLVTHAVAADSPGVETATTASSKYAYCNGDSTGIYSHFSDSDRVGITSGTFVGASGVSYFPYGGPTSINLHETYDVEGVGVGWSYPGSSWHISGATLTFDKTIAGSSSVWYQNHNYSLKATGFIAYYEHDINGTFDVRGNSCQITDNAGDFF